MSSKPQKPAEKNQPRPAQRKDWLAHHAASAGLDDKALLSVREWLAEQFIGDEYAQLGHAGHGDKQIPLRRVFVDLPMGTHAASLSDHAGETTPFLQEMQEFTSPLLSDVRSGRFAKHDELGDLDSSGAEFTPQQNFQGVGKASKASLRGCHAAGTILVGGPGQGKSTLCQLLCQLHRAALLLGDPAPKTTFVQDVLVPFEVPESNPGLQLPIEPLLPVRIVLPDASTWLARSPAAREVSPTVPILLKFISLQKSATEVQLTADTLAALMAKMPFLLVLDGLDEIGAEEDRKRIVEAIRDLISAFANQGARATIVATTRPQGYMGELETLGVPLMTRYLSRLSTKEALEYAFKLLDEKIKGLDERERRKTQLRAAAEESATARLLQTPLQVTILAALIQEGNVPNERWRLFESYLRIVYQREVDRSIAASELLKSRKTQIESIHARAALLLQVEAEASGGASSKMSRERFRAIVEQVLQEEGIDDAVRGDLAEKIVKVAETRLVFLVEPEPGYFGFEIRSLQEFMAAWALVVDVPESRVEARILQIAKAPMFRNVLLFMASKIYGGTSNLREYVAKTACAKLNEDPSDAVARETRAGAWLALEILEEGAVLPSARYSRELMLRAAEMLDLPPSEIHPRLVGAINNDTERVFIEAVEKRIKDGSSKDAVTSWLCLIEAANRGHAWADRLANAYWPGMQFPNEVLLACLYADVYPSDWFVAKINGNPAIFEPSWLTIEWSPFHRDRAKTIQSRLRRSLASVIHAIRRSGHSYFWDLGSRLVLITPEVERKTLPKDLDTARGWSPSWRAWTSVIEFEENPSAIQLSRTLRDIAKNLTPTEWRKVSNRVSWPLQACLDAAVDANELEQIASAAQALVLGDRDDWIRAEERWKKGINIRKTLLAAHEGQPFTKESILEAPPVACLAANIRYGGWRPPAHVALSDWLEVYDTLRGIVSDRPRSTLLMTALSAYLASPSNAGWIHVIAVYASEVLVESVSVGLRTQLASSLTVHTQATPSSRMEASAIRLWLGEIAEADAQPLFRHWRQHIDEGCMSQVDVPQLIARSAYRSETCEQFLIQWRSLVSQDLPASYVSMRVLRQALQSRRSGLDNLTTWSALGLPEPYPQSRSSEVARSPIPSKPIVLEKLHLQHVRGIQDLVFEFAPPPSGKGQWIVLLGRNGVGKTTILRALCLALRNLDDSKIWPPGVWDPPWRESGQDAAARIAVQIEGHRDECITTIHNGTQRHRQTPPHAEPRLFPLFAYGCRRGSALGGEAEAVHLKEEGGPEIATLFHEGAGLIHAETWLKEWALYSYEDATNARPIYEAVLAALQSLLEVKSIFVKERQVHVEEKSGRVIPFAALSDGYITTAGWFLDLIARWIELCKRAGLNIGKEFLKQMRGLVLIDEIDLHLHPKWQIESIRRTRELMPEMSFLVTTHNPLSLVGAKPEEIFNLKEIERRVVAERGEVRPMLLTSSEIFTQYFDVEDVLPAAIGQKLRRYESLSRNPTRNEVEQEEMLALKTALAAEDIVPNWPVVERVSLRDTTVPFTSVQASRRRKTP